MKTISLTCLLLCFISNSLFAQSSFSDEDAINIFKSYPPIFGFEGIYEIAHRTAFSNGELVADEELSDSKFEVENKKICIYSTSNGISTRFIDFNNNWRGYSDLEHGYFKADLFGTLTFNLYWGNKNFYDEKNELITSKVKSKDETLVFDFHKVARDLTDMRSQFLLKRIYKPDGIKTTPETGSSSFGTGFLINNKGYLITNFHVVEDAKSIYVSLNNAGKVECFLIASDKDNDLALLKIKEGNKSFMNTKTFKFNFNTSEVGSDVFTLGYPMIDKMGTEIKVTSGIISSSTGYQGDKTTYQITAPIQPGNSGGPLFNSKGEVIGITNAKLKGAENASYAIKAIFLNKLITNEGLSFNNSTGNINVSTLSLPQKIQILKNNIFIISCLY